MFLIIPAILILESPKQMLHHSNPPRGRTGTHVLVDLTCPLLHPVASGMVSTIAHVCGVFVQLLVCFIPREYRVNCRQSPFSLRFSSSTSNPPVAWLRIATPSSLITFQFSSSFLKNQGILR